MKKHEPEVNEHKGHRIVKDAFAQLPGVSRSVPGDLYCLDCKCPVAPAAAAPAPTGEG